MPLPPYLGCPWNGCKWLVYKWVITPRYTPFISRWNNPLKLTIDPNFRPGTSTPSTSQVRCPSNNSANSKLADFTTKPADPQGFPQRKVGIWRLVPNMGMRPRNSRDVFFRSLFFCLRFKLVQIWDDTQKLLGDSTFFWGSNLGWYAETPWRYGRVSKDACIFIRNQWSYFLLSLCSHKKPFGILFTIVGGFNPFKKYSSKWESSPNRGENKKYLKPPPSYDLVGGFQAITKTHIP